MNGDAGVFGRYGSVDRGRRSSANQSLGAEMTAGMWIWQPRQVTAESNRDKRRAELQEVRSLETTLKPPGICDPSRDGSARPALVLKSHGLFFMPNSQTGDSTSRSASRERKYPWFSLILPTSNQPYNCPRYPTNALGARRQVSNEAVQHCDIVLSHISAYLQTSSHVHSAPSICRKYRDRVPRTDRRSPNVRRNARDRGKQSSRQQVHHSFAQVTK